MPGRQDIIIDPMNSANIYESAYRKRGSWPMLRVFFCPRKSIGRKMVISSGEQESVNEIITDEDLGTRRPKWHDPTAEVDRV